MDIVTFLEFIKTNPSCYFVAGVVIGYFLRGFVANGFFSGLRSKRPSRYQSKQVGPPVKLPSVAAKLNEPAFDWSEAAVKATEPRRLRTHQESKIRI
jgi:hypothetical protein